MNRVLHDIPLTEALSVVRATLAQAHLAQPFGSETIPLDELASGRSLAEAVWARISSPSYTASAAEGFAVNAAKTVGATPEHPVVLKDPGQTIYVRCGDPLSRNTDAVVPLEQVEECDLPAGRGIRLRAPTVTGRNVNRLGDDMIASQLVLTAGRLLSAVDLGAIAAAGIRQIKVTRKIRVGIIPTGDELIKAGKTPKKGQTIELNSIVLASQIQTWGGEPTRLPIVADDEKAITRTIQKACKDMDLILVIAGSADGKGDQTARVLSQLGRLVFDHVAVRPGHELLFAMLSKPNGDQVPVFGMPGFPVSAALMMEVFIRPMMEVWTGSITDPAPEQTALLTRTITSPRHEDEFMRVSLARVNNQLLAIPLSRGEGQIYTLAQSDGMVRVPRGTSALKQGETVQVRTFCREEEIERTILMVGAYDASLDYLCEFLSRQRMRFVPINTGSIAGLKALQRNHAHLSGSNLVDPANKGITIDQIRDHLPGMRITAFHWVQRTQGLILAKGNPKGIRSITDLNRQDVSFLNREPGSGTRLLLDQYLRKVGLAESAIPGYATVENTHLAIAASVLSGKSDAGLGIEPAARALGLDFIPLFEEEFQLIVPEDILAGGWVDPILNLAQKTPFRKVINRLPGYRSPKIGEVAWQISS